MTFEEDIREAKLKLNDDRRVNINLGAFAPKVKGKPGASALGASALDKPNGKMLLLTVRVQEASRKVPYDRAWYRLINSDTSQTLDYKHFKEIKGPDAASDEPAAGGEEGEEAAATKVTATQTYVAGRIF